jgi:hypothetical protein
MGCLEKAEELVTAEELVAKAAEELAIGRLVGRITLFELDMIEKKERRIDDMVKEKKKKKK